MTDRTVLVRLRVEVGQFNSNMDSAAKSVDKVAKATEKAAKTSEKGVMTLRESARKNSESWNTVGTALMGVGGAITAFGAAALTTGIKYNTLQQTSRAALTTIFKDGEKANQQMDRLDAFARTSPFAKDVFIRAQQQMLGFGIESQKVIPYLDAIQNAVAATGGSNQDIEELTRIFSQISASSKITASDLMQFGKRGLDAATIIGESMGKTGAEIRDEITAGTLDAGEALDALAAGMANSYAGSAAAVKETFEGAIDRVKAAWREFGAELATPLVNPDGGGLAIDALNALADAMNRYRSLPTAVKATTTAVVGLSGAAALAGGTLMVALPKYVAFRDAVEKLGKQYSAIKTIDSGLSRLGKTMGKLGLVVGAGLALARVFDAITGPAKTAAMGVEEVTLALQQGGIEDVVSRYSGSMSSLSDAFEAVLSDSFNAKMDRFGSGLNNFLGGHFSDRVNDGRQALAELDAGISNLANSGDIESATRLFEEMVAAAEQDGYTREQLLEQMPQYREALAAVALEQENAAGSAKELADATAEAEAAAEAAAEALELWISSVADTDSSFISLLGAYQDVVNKNKEVAQSTADATADATDSWEDFYDGVSFSMSAYLDSLQEQVEAQRDWRANLIKLSGQVSEGVLKHLADMGPEGAALVAGFVDASSEELAQMEELFAFSGQESGTNFAQNLYEAGSVMSELLAVAGQEAVDSAAEAIAAGEITLADVVRSYDLSIELELDTEPAEKEFNRETQKWEATQTDTNLGLDTSYGEGVFKRQTESWINTRSDTKLGLDPSYGVGVFKRQTDSWIQQTSTTKLGLDVSGAKNTFDFARDSWRNSSTITNLGLNTQPARNTLNTTRDNWRNITTNTQLGMSTRPASTTLSNARSNWRNTTTLTLLDLNTRPASNALSNWRNNNSGRSITQYVNVVTRGGAGRLYNHAAADGGILVNSYANGKLPDQAMIQPARPGLVQWAEPETKGEAFIPLAENKRPRSIQIWQETGERLGVFNNPNASSTPSSSPAVASLSGSDRELLRQVAQIASRPLEATIAVGRREFATVIAETDQWKKDR